MRQLILLVLLGNIAAAQGTNYAAGPGAGLAVDVRDYGARCDGAADDAAAFRAALASLPAGGSVTVPPGVCRIGTSIRIQHPVILSGAGGGGLSAGPPHWDTFTAATTIQNTSATQPAILIQGEGDAWVSGVLLKDFAIDGNPAGAGADNIRVVGTRSSHVRHLQLQNVLSYHASGCGITLDGNAYGIDIFSSQFQRNAGSGICVTDPDDGSAVSTLNLFGVWSDLNGADGIRISGRRSASIVIHGGFYADNAGSGIHTARTAVDTRVSCFGCSMESNAFAAAHLEGGYGHVFSECYASGLPGGRYGFYVDNPGSNYAQVSATVRGCEINSNTIRDFFISARARNVQIWPQASLSSAYTITDLGYQTQFPAASGRSVEDGAPRLSTGLGSPSAPPAKVGDIYVDGISGRLYVSVGTLSADNWRAVR